MKIVLSSIYHLNPYQGAPKVSIEFCRILKSLGHDVSLVGPKDYGDPERRSHDGNRLTNYLWEKAADADVVEVDHEALPVKRTMLPPKPLIVARSVLLVQQMRTLRMPRSMAWRDRLRRLRYYRRDRAHLQERLSRSDKTLECVDLINVTNQHDLQLLIAQGISPSKICLFPFGLTLERRNQLLRPVISRENAPTVGFVGTFDARKGACDFPKIWAAVRRAVPLAELVLIGTGHLAPKEVRSKFKLEDRKSITVIPKFNSDKLGLMLQPINVGVFPSYYEGFPFGVLEMLAASIPVIAYDAPGPPMMVPQEWLAVAGDWQELADKVVQRLQASKLDSFTACERAKQIAERFDWFDIAVRTLERYQAEISKRVPAIQPG